MPDTTDIRTLWVTETVRVLRGANSWTGRIHIHKALVLGELLGLLDTPFEFEIYRYGPYSFDLDSEIAEMETSGLLTKDYVQPNYGPKYSNSSLAADLIDKLDDDARARLLRIASQIGSWRSQDLELVSTCLWVQRREGVTSSPDVVKRVQALKPHYDGAQIEQGIRKAAELAASLQQ